MVIRTDARDADGNVLAEGTFKVVPLRPEKFKSIAGIAELPERWARFLERDPE